jgi:tripartite-type tricarboxylate transporter receptor subunit TctC
VLARPEVKERFFAAGIEVVGSAPEELAAVMKSEMTRLAKVIKAAGISAD